MKQNLLPWLACPFCGGNLIVSAAVVLEPIADEIETGSLSCASCRRQYPICDGIPRLAPGGLNARAEKTRVAFGWEWNRYPGSLPEDGRILLEESQLCPQDFTGRRVLDAGCGMGRYALAALDMGAEVIAIDLSESLRRLAPPAQRHPRLHVVEGDLLHPPFKPRTFDLVYSHGVLHHTSDTHAAFKEVAALVKTEGKLSVWLYGKAGQYNNFATNPIRTDKEWARKHRRLAWMIVAIRHFISDCIRAVSTRLPIFVVYALCYPLAILGAVPGLKYITYSVHPDFKVRLIENFDWISPPFQHHHTKEELASWYEQEGFVVERILPHGLVPKPGILGRKTT